MTGNWDHSVDVLVIGSGNGGLTAAICNYEMGTPDVLVIEKGEKVGGTSATSGGGIWIPCSRYAKAAGADDSLDAAREYLRHTLEGEDIPQELVDAYLENGPRMLDFLHERTDVRYVSLEHYPDYYTTLPGARTGHRSLEPEPVMASELGDNWRNMTWTHHMMRLFGLIHFTQVEAAALTVQAPGWIKLVMGMLWDYVTDIPWRLKTRISRRLCCGSAGVARLYLSLLKRNIPLWLSSPMVELIEKDGRVIGAVVSRDGKRVRVQARKAVIMASGGFEKNQQLREKYLPAPTNTAWSAGAPTNTGDGLLQGQQLGAATRMMEGAWWTTTLCVPGEDVPRLSIMEKSFPGSCVVNLNGRRVANESQNYMAYQKDLFKVHSEDNYCAPLYQIFDARFRRNYIAGPLMTAQLKPDWTIPRDWFEQKFVAKANTISELAVQVGIDAAMLEQTVADMNGYARTGKDEAFGRGDSDYDRYYADPSIKPNPCLAPIDEAPFYAMRVEVGDFGTQGGLDTDVHARVKKPDGSFIEGLYACGNCAAPILSTYPGPGSTLGPAMTMAYQASKYINHYQD